MVTLIKYGALSGGEKYNVNVLSIDGLSTDTKPTVTYIEYGSDGREVGRMGIPNGSIFTEIDTGNTYMYDVDATTWHKVSIDGGGGGTQGGIVLVGETTTALADEATTNPITVDGQPYTAQPNDAVIYGSKEFLFDGTKWHEFGDLSGLASKDIGAMTGYAKASTGSAIAPTDTLNQAIGKVEKRTEVNENNISLLDDTKADAYIASDNRFVTSNKTYDTITISYKNGVTKITGTGSYRGWINIGRVYLPTGTYYINAGQSTRKPSIYLRDGKTNIANLTQASRVSSAFTITEAKEYTLDAYIGYGETYNFENYLQIGTTNADVFDEFCKSLSPDFKKPFGGVKYEAIGDSLTYGFIGFDGGGQQVRLDNPYPSRVSQLLGMYYMYNKGETGTTIANDLSVMETYYPMSNDTRLATYVNADVISIMGGTNDYTKATAMGTLGTADDTTFYGGLQKIINYLRTNNPTAFIFVIIPTITNGYSTANSAGNTFKDYKNAMIDVCEAYGVPYIDMSVYGELTYGYTSQWTVDGLHYNQAYTDKIFAPLIADFINHHYNRNTKY